MENFEPAKALGLDIHLLVDGDPENKVKMLPLPHSSLTTTTCHAEPHGGCPGGTEYRRLLKPETQQCQNTVKSQCRGQKES